ncbi:MAG: hypothetical protein U1F20_09675 [Lysobacterales bacterium]
MDGNAVGWFEIYVGDSTRSKAFYEAVLATRLERLDSGDIEMWAFPRGAERPGAAGATEPAKPDAPPFYGLLPLAIRKGQLVAGIVLTTPVMLLTRLRGAFKFYEVDAGKRVVRYRNAAGDPWIEYAVKPEEEARAHAWFEEHDETAQNRSEPPHDRAPDSTVP